MAYFLLAMLFPTATAFWGWVSVVFLAAVIFLPFVYRAKAASEPDSDAGSARPYLRALWPHYWLAPMVFVISFIHAWIPMASGKMPRTSMEGLWLATYALGLMFVQLLLGLALRYGRFRSVGILRRVHFGLMLGIVALLLSHLWLNGPLRGASALLGR